MTWKETLSIKEMNNLNFLKRILLNKHIGSLL